MAKRKPTPRTGVRVRGAADWFQLAGRIERAAWKRRKRLDLSGEGIDELPEQICQLVDLRELDLGGNQLTGLPTGIGQLASLEKLTLRRNQLTTLPGEIGLLTNLRSLDLSDNQLTSLPEQIGQLENLEVLYLFQNQLSQLPDEIGRLARLRHLAVFGNKLERLPRSIGNLTTLEVLHIGYKPLDGGNPLVDLPAELQNLSSLRDLNLTLCPALNLPPEIVAKRDSPHEILGHYFRSRTQPARPLNEAKVLVVGEAGVGKTSLIKQLFQLGDFDPREDQTHGIVIHRQDLTVTSPPPGALLEGKGEEDRTVRLNVWDFGGQEIMHATHQFFLTKRSLYVLVLDSRQNELQSRIEYWLKLIHSFGADSPVIVVCNKCDQQHMQLDWSGLQAKYPQIRRYVKAVSCADKLGVEEVNTAIEEEIARLEHVDTMFPVPWFQVKQRLEECKQERASQGYLPYADYVEMCEKTGITDEKEERQLIGFLHDLGIVLHFHDHPILRDLNILNPLWVTTAVYRILTCKELSEAHGVLTFDELGTLLEAVAGKGFEYPPERQMFVIEMMRRFELLFDFEGQVNEKFLVPGLLPLEQPPGLDAGWDDSLRFRYQYEVLPGSVISRFIVRMHQRIHQETYWRKGVVLESLDGDVQARVQADFEDARIDIRLRGQARGRRRFLQSIRDQFDAIHTTISGIAVEEQVPLPEHPEVLVDYGRLLLFEKKRKPFDYEKVRGELIEINVADLLEGIRHPPGLDVFISYAHEDAKSLVEFNKMLSPVVRDGRITTWSDRDISASQFWREEIDRALAMARSGLLLVSPAFLASDFIMKHELPYLLRAHEDGRARIFIAVLSSCLWKETQLKEIQTAHDPSKPLDTLTKAKRNAAIKSICEELMKRG